MLLTGSVESELSSQVTLETFRLPGTVFDGIYVHLQITMTRSVTVLMLSPATSWQPSPMGQGGGRAKQEAKSHRHLKNNQSCCTNHISLHLSSKHTVGICCSHILQIIKVLFNLQKYPKRRQKKQTTKNTPEHPYVFEKSKTASHFTAYIISSSRSLTFGITFSDQQFFSA